MLFLASNLYLNFYDFETVAQYEQNNQIPPQAYWHVCTFKEIVASIIKGACFMLFLSFRALLRIYFFILTLVLKWVNQNNFHFVVEINCSRFFISPTDRQGAEIWDLYCRNQQRINEPTGFTSNLFSSLKRSFFKNRTA